MKIKNITKERGVSIDIKFPIKLSDGRIENVVLKPNAFMYVLDQEKNKWLIIQERKNNLEITEENISDNSKYYVELHEDQNKNNEPIVELETKIEVESSTETGEGNKEELEPKKNKGGRPKGSKNKRKRGRPKKAKSKKKKKKS